MSKILISGYYGFNNLGDEAILETTITRIRKSIHDADIAVLSATPEKTSYNYSVRAYNRKGIRSVVEAIRDCDVLVSGGGSLLQDVTGKMSIKYYLAIIFLAKLFGKKVMVYSQGIGPINKPNHRWMTKCVLNYVDCITVREENSKLDLIEMGLKASSISVTADPVIDLEPVNREEGMTIIKRAKGRFDSERKTVGFALRTKDFNQTEDFERLKAAVEILVNDYNVVFIPFHYNEDLGILLHLKECFGDAIVTVEKRYDTHDILSVISLFNVLVGVRLHSLIFAAVEGVPPIGISYDPKIDYFMETLGLATLCRVNDLEALSLKNEIDRILKDETLHKEKLHEVVNDLKHKIDVNDRLLVDLLKRGK